VSISTGQAVAIGVTLVVLRVAAGLAVAQQSSTLRASVLLNTRRELGDAYLDASWAAQHGQPPGKLQELLTQFAERKMGSGPEPDECGHGREQPRRHARHSGHR
jgi:hypothetical protein